MGLGLKKRWLNIVIALMLSLSLVLPASIVRAEEPSAAASEQVSVKVDVRVEGYKGTIAKLHDFVATGNAAVTAEEVTKQALDANAIPYINKSGYFQSINGEADSELGVASGWMYKVNGVYPDVYAPDYEIKDGDEIVWHYINSDSVVQNMTFEGITYGSGVDTVDKVTFEPIIDMPTTAVSGEPIKIKVTGIYSIYSFGYDTIEEDLLANLDQVTIEMNGKQYVTDQNGEATIPAEDVKAGTYELRFTKDLPGTLLYYNEEREIPSYPRIIRTYKELTIQEPVVEPTPREKVEKALEKGKTYFLTEKSLVNTRVNESYSGYWMLSAMYAAGVDIKSYPWNVSPTSENTAWTKAAGQASSAANEDSGTIIGAKILGLDPTNLKTRNYVEDLIAKQKASGMFSTIWGESFALVALDLVNAQYKQAEQIDAILKLQNATTGYFGDLDATGWILFALAPHRDQPAVESAIQKAVAGYHKSFIEKGFIDNANSMASIISGLASVGEDLFSNKWTYEKDGKTINIVSYLAEKYQLENGGIRWKAADTKSNLMALEQVYIAFSDALHQKSTFVRLKESTTVPPVEGPGTGGENPGNGNGNPGNGNGNGNGNENQTISTYISIRTGSSTLLNEFKADVPANATAFDVLQKAANLNGISLQTRKTSMGMYVEGINGLKEFDKGPKSGWMYRVNGVFPEYASDAYSVKAGDRMEWVYTEDLGNDVGGGTPTVEVPAIIVESKDGEMKAEVSAEIIKQKLQDKTTNVIVIADKNGTKIELPKLASLTDAAKLTVSVKQSGDAISVHVEVVDKDGKVVPFATSNEYMKVTTPVENPTNNTVVLVKVNGEYRAVPHTIVNNQIVIYTKVNNDFVITTTHVSFNDLDRVNNRDEIEFLASRYVVKGQEAGTFNPLAEITRGEFAAMISRALGLQSSGKGSFDDTAGKWYEGEVQALFEAGITEGTSATTFNPDAQISREQAAVLMARVLAYVKYQTDKVAKDNYSDAADIHSYFLDDIKLLQALDIMTGKSDGTFDPEGKLTRAQMAKILKRTLNVSGLM